MADEQARRRVIRQASQQVRTGGAFVRPAATRKNAPSNAHARPPRQKGTLPPSADRQSQ
jgi:hypothetical protein